MSGGLQIYEPRERLLVGAADLLLSPLAWRRRPAPPDAPGRVLLLRLERIGDLLMTRDAIAAVRARWPSADIDLVVGSWNASLAAMIDGPSRVHTLDVPWLAREGTGLSWAALIGAARRWHRERYDVVVNFEPDIRSNLLAWLSGAPVCVGYWTGGGGALLTHALAYDPAAHVSTNAHRLLDEHWPVPTDRPASAVPRPDAAAEAATADLLRTVPGASRWIGIHASGGRESKQWHLDRFAAVAAAIAREHDAVIVLTGGPGDRPQVDAVKARLDGVAHVDAAGRLDLAGTAALLARLDLLVTGDTGPMHLADAVGTPVVALFGPSDPRRYGPTAPGQEVVRVQLPCSPCGQVRLPPERCRGHVPDCMDGITVDMVLTAARRALARGRRA